MRVVEEQFLQSITAPVRQIKGRVELFQGSTLIDTFNSDDRLKSFSVERVGEESKFIGFGICQKLTTKLLDKDRLINVNEKFSLRPYFGVEYGFTPTNPLFNIRELSRDEITNELTLIAYDALYEAAKIQINKLGLVPPYTLADVAAACAGALNVHFNPEALPQEFALSFPEGANVDGSETVRQILDAIAEATQTIYYINYNDELIFVRLNLAGEPVETISKAKYFDLESSVPCVLTKICHATALGDNVEYGSDIGFTQYIRDNPFWNMREDIDTLVLGALANVENLSINQFTCSWRGNYFLEIGDKIAIETKDCGLIYAYLINDTITYDGALKEKTEWAYEESSAETLTNPATLGEALKETIATVDKVNKRIDLMVKEVDENSENISALTLNTQSIAMSVSQLEKTTNEAVGDMAEDVASLKQSVDAMITAEDLTIAVKNELSNGVDKVVTETGFKFDDEGLSITKTGSELSTQITEDGMTISKNGTELLSADNTGVKAMNLHATTYLIIGKYSRFEDYTKNYEARTGCFWIGG